MADIANEHVGNYLSGKWGISIREYNFAKNTKANLKDQMFSVVKVRGGNTNRLLGMILTVCEQSDTHYWVWANKGITGIAKTFAMWYNQI